MRSRPSLFVSIGLLVISVLAWWLWPRESGSRGRASRSPVTARAGEPTSPAKLQRIPSAGQSESAIATLGAGSLAPREAEGDVEDAPGGDLLLYAERPMSSVPHRVARAWGITDDPRHLGLVGAHLVVAPDISEGELRDLCRDISSYHRDAKVLGVRILDSEGAATYPRDTDGGGLAERHLLARVSRDASLGVETCLVRGEAVKP